MFERHFHINNSGWSFLPHPHQTWWSSCSIPTKLGGISTPSPPNLVEFLPHSHQTWWKLSASLCNHMAFFTAFAEKNAPPQDASAIFLFNKLQQPEFKPMIHLRKYSLYFIGPVLYQMTDLTPLFPKFSLLTEASMTLSPFFSRRL